MRKNRVRKKYKWRKNVSERMWQGSIFLIQSSGREEELEKVKKDWKEKKCCDECEIGKWNWIPIELWCFSSLIELSQEEEKRNGKNQWEKTSGRLNSLHFDSFHSWLGLLIENTLNKKRIANDWFISWLRILVILYIREWSNQEQQNFSSCISFLNGFYFLFFLSEIHSSIPFSLLILSFFISSLPLSLPFSLFLPPPLGIKLTLWSRWKFITRDSC